MTGITTGIMTGWGCGCLFIEAEVIRLASHKQANDQAKQA